MASHTIEACAVKEFEIINATKNVVLLHMLDRRQILQETLSKQGKL